MAGPELMQVITRVNGTLLGIINNFYVDPRTLSVVSMSLRPKGLGMAPRGNLLLSTLCQIGDVALVHDERALDLPPLAEREGCIRLTGRDIQAHDGTLLGKVWFICNLAVCSDISSAGVCRQVPFAIFGNPQVVK
jgi:hypothetical protein